MNPFTDIRDSYEGMLENKQTLKDVEVKQVDLEKEQISKISEKNLVHKLRTVNRSPVNRNQQQENLVTTLDDE